MCATRKGRPADCKVNWRVCAAGLAGDGNRALSCAAREAHLAKHCIQFFGAERWLDDELCPDRFLYLTVLRDPIRRIESNCRYERIQPRDALDWLQNTSYFPEETRVYEGTAAVDNFYVRSLCGPRVFHLPAGTLTDAHLADAKRRLGVFEALLILEEYELGLPQLEALLGWKRPKDKKDAHRSFGPGDSTIAFTPEQRRTLADRNRLDIELYAYAKRRSRAITAACLASLGATGGAGGSANGSAGGGQARRAHTWKEAYILRTSARSREKCQLDFAAWERDAKKEKAAWLRKREAASVQRKALMKKLGIADPVVLRQREAATLVGPVGHKVAARGP